jgi:DNA invertase Pin-like site-specific DNA recombinase
MVGVEHQSYSVMRNKNAHRSSLADCAAKGVKFGRPNALTPYQRQEAIERLEKGEAQADVARSYGVSQATISRPASPSPFEVAAKAAWDDVATGS